MSDLKNKFYLLNNPGYITLYEKSSKPPVTLTSDGYERYSKHLGKFSGGRLKRRSSKDEIIFDNSRNHKNYVLFSGKV